MSSNNKHKLLITASTFPRWDNDTEPRFILDYAKAMLAYYDVIVLVPMCPGAAKEEEFEGVKVVRYHYFPIHKAETLCYPGAIAARIKQKKARAFLVPFLLMSLRHAIKKTVRRYGIDVIHHHWFIPQGIVQGTIKPKVPFIITGHGGDIGSFNKGLFLKLKRKCIKRAAAVTVVSAALEDKVHTLIDSDVKCHIIPMGCDTKLFAPSNRVDNMWNQGSKRVVLFVGRLAQIKGVNYLIEAMNSVDDAVLVIVGKGECEDALKEQAKSLGDKVIFAGAKTHEELRDIYPSADVFVMPSITMPDGAKEGFGLTAIEAMASGLPVVGSNSGGIAEIIQDGYNGILVDEKNPDQIANAINELLSDDSRRAAMALSAVQTANQHSYEEVARQYNQILKTVGGK